MADQRLPLNAQLPAVLETPQPNAGIPMPGTSQPIQFAPPPQFQQSDPGLLEVISALSGLGLNIAGAVNGRGAMGNGMLGNAQSLGQQRMQQDAVLNKRNEDLADQKNKETQSTAIWNRAQAVVKDPLRLEQVKAYLSTRESDKANAMVSADEADQRYEERWARSERKQMDALREGRVDSFIKGLKEAKDETEKSINPEVKRALAIQRIAMESLEGSKDIPRTPEALSFNLKAKGISVNRDEAIELHDELKRIKDDAEPGFFGRLNGKQADYQGAFSKYAEGKFGAGAIKTHQDQEARLQQISQESQYLRKIYGARDSKRLQEYVGTKLAELEGRVPAQQQQAPATDMVRVISPDGQPGSIPAANLEKAKAKGYKLAQ